MAETAPPNKPRLCTVSQGVSVSTQLVARSKLILAVISNIASALWSGKDKQDTSDVVLPATISLIESRQMLVCNRRVAVISQK